MLYSLSFARDASTLSALLYLIFEKTFEENPKVSIFTSSYTGAKSGWKITLPLEADF